MMNRILPINECRYCPLLAPRGPGNIRAKQWHVCTHRYTYEQRVEDIDCVPGWCCLMTIDEFKSYFSLDEGEDDECDE